MQNMEYENTDHNVKKGNFYNYAIHLLLSSSKQLNELLWKTIMFCMEEISRSMDSLNIKRPFMQYQSIWLWNLVENSEDNNYTDQSTAQIEVVCKYDMQVIP